ncbi:MAG: benzoyl-CoA 2,3-epoxidase subunit BoxB [Planctomycetes bacterium]|nr:benzoyl-CoA 2,3-epoxidase subunit BoxB [Planctomycetota bacterium]
MSINYSEKIPNNVDLSSDRRLQRALEKWQPAYLDWWAEMGPTDFNDKDVYLRTAVSVDRDGWAQFGYVKMPDYRWGIFLTPPEKDRKVGFGDHLGEAAWQEVPGEYRNSLRRLIVTQADTEPASVEQQRLLGHTAPSLYDLRNLFQVNVEEGRHLWAMVYLLHSYFGKDGREEAEELLERRSGNADRPRILSTFNEPVQDWLSFFCFTTFTDRDGKYQLLALAESGFDPLARSCRFMLTEEAHHMFVGQTGINRTIQRTCEVMKAHPGEDVTKYGAIPLEMIQKWINRWASSSVDLFGAEISSNAATFFAQGLKGRAHEEKNYERHDALDEGYAIAKWDGKSLVNEDVPLRNAMNEVLRTDYWNDNAKQAVVWTKTTASFDIPFEFSIPDRRFNRKIGMYADGFFTPAGEPIDEATWNARRGEWLPTPEDEAYVKALMVKCHEPGKYAGWIAPPSKGINDQGVDFEYVKM